MPLPVSQSLAARQADRAAAYKARHGLQEHELVLYAAYAPADHDLASNVEPEVTVVRIEPTPRIVNKPLDTVIERAGEGLMSVRLQRYEVSEISRQYTDVDLTPLFWVIAQRDQEVKVDDVMKTGEDQVYSRYRLQGSPNLYQNGWTLMLVESK